MVELPEELYEQEDEYYGTARDRVIQEKYNGTTLDYKPWDNLESIDSMLEPFGLEIIYFDDSDEPYFAVAKREETNE